jgi:histidinol-phosphate aminotransferase
MCLNESSLNPITAIADKMMEAFKQVELNRYVSGVTAKLKKELADYVGHGVKPTQILFGNGVDDMLYFLFTAVRDSNKSYALSLAPSYFDYKTYSGSVGLEMEFLDFERVSSQSVDCFVSKARSDLAMTDTEDFDFSSEEYLAKLNHPDCKFGIICNPNNPTGHLIPEDKIMHIISHTEKPILLDETYFEFSGVTLIDYIKQYPNIIISRSFSKSFSAAGLRFGYIISNEENMSYLNKVIPVYNSSILIQAMALCILENREIFKNNVGLLNAEKEAMYQQMKSYKEISVYPSWTNFLTFSLGEKSDEFYRYLLDNDISVRPVGGHPLLANYLRVTVCGKDSNRAFLKALDEFLKR